MISKVYSAIPYGYEGYLVEVEGTTNRGLPGFNIVGMADKTINESRERVKSALINSDFTFPDKRITINLAPADLPKDGSYLDLPIALSILISSNQLRQEDIDKKMFIGELSLDGKIRPIRGIINIIEAAKKNGFQEIYIPEKNIAQASLLHGVQLYGVKNLQQLFLHLKNEKKIRSQSSCCKKNTNRF